MSVFDSTERFYATMQALFDELQRVRPGATRSLERSRISLRFSVSQPQAQVWINGRARPATVHYGERDGRIDLDVLVSADSLHDILLGRQGIRKAMSRREMQVRGPIFKAVLLADLFDQARQIYPAIAAQQDILS